MSISLADHLAAIRARRAPLTPDEARTMVARANAHKFLTRLRPVRWPDADPLGGPDVAFVLGIHPNAIHYLMASGRLEHTQSGRRYYVTQAALRAYLHERLDEARALGLSVPPAALQVAGPRPKALGSQRSPSSRP